MGSEEESFHELDEQELRAFRRSTYKNLTVMSLGFLFLFTAFQALQNLQSSIHDDKQMGWWSLCLIYLSLLISCMFVPPLVISKLGAKYTVMLSMVGYVLFTVANFYPRRWTLFPASIILGFCGAPLWAAKCSYVTTKGIKYGKATGKNEDNVITNFFGLFFLIFQSGQIWGNLISSQILKPSDSSSNDTRDTGLICGANFCPSTNISSINQQTSDSTVTTLMLIYLGFGCLAIAVIFFFLDQEKILGETKKKGVCDLFIATIKHLKNMKMLLLIPITMFSGLEQGFVFGDFTRAFVTCTLGIEKVGLIMICFGVVDAFFSLFLGKIVEWWTGRPIMMISGALVNLGLLILFYVWHPRESTVYVFYIGAALWGFCDAVWQTQVNAFYGVLFPTNQEAAFSNYRLWESVGFVIAFAYGNYICISTKIQILICFLILGVALYGVIEFKRKNETETYDTHMENIPS